MGPSQPHSMQVHGEKYREPGEGYREAMNRIANALSDGPEHFKVFREIIADMRFCPAGRIQAAAGSMKHITMYNCFVSPSIHDSFVHGNEQGRNSIMDIATQAAATMRMGGGIGYDWSTLRPSRDLIRGVQSHTDGPLAFLHINDAVCRATSSAGNRRGAQMGVLRIDHPDILAFIRAKQPSDQLQVLWDHVESLPADHPGRHQLVLALQETLRLTGFNLSIAITDEFMECLASGRPFPLKFGGRVYNEVDPAELWEYMMRSTWDWAEPGVLFIDTINRMNNLWYCETIAATNPCFTGDTKVWTDRGNMAFKDLVGKTVNVLTQDWSGRPVYRPMSNIRITQRAARLVRVKFDNGTEVRCTPNHMFFLRGGGQLEASRLQPGMSIASAYRYKANSKGYLCVATEGESVLEHHIPFEGGIPEGYDVHHIDEVKSHNWVENLELKPSSQHLSGHMAGDRNPSRRFPEQNPFLSLDVRGEGNPRYRHELSTESMLADREAGLSYEQIAKRHGCSRYTARKRVVESNHKVVSVEYLVEIEDVYCGSVDEFNRFFVSLGDNDGVLVHNCGEQPLPPYGACLLGSFNAVRYVCKRDDGSYFFDYDQLRADIPPVVRGMDNVVDRSTYPLVEQGIEARNKRRMGLGITGLANAGEALGCPYGSPAFLAFERELLTVILHETYRASVQLAREKGAFPLFDAEKYCAGEFIKTLPADLVEDIRRYGIHNSHLTSIAPTGTISYTADNVSSGLEPVIEYEGQRWMNMLSGKELVDIQDYGVREFGVYGKLASQVTAQEHVDVLVTAAALVDSAVSKTCNVSPDMPWDDFKNIYVQVYDRGGKGCTTFNPGGKRLGIFVAKAKRAVQEDVDVETMVSAAEAAPEIAESCVFDPSTGRRSCE